MARAWKLHDNVNTDEIIPGRYNVTTDRSQLARYCLCEVRPDFPEGVKPGDIVVAARNFGCGSSREHAPVALQACGVKAVVANTFARIFYRNAINVGLPLLICPEAVAAVSDGDQIDVDTEAGLITVNETQYRAAPVPAFVKKIAHAGGILDFIKQYGWEGI
ncbi:MAG TPA: 3-isopropylmalate dehydratase small subunit [Chloroflexota bacterium]|jgi:3-isopropylmalate dehydratase small subunit|nr:3-isopropylmalate dehydratase small subunit [Chloroflexota bacterium]